MLTLEEIQRRMKAMRVKPVADATGIHPSQLSRIVHGHNANPSYALVKKLSDHLQSL